MQTTQELDVVDLLRIQHAGIRKLIEEVRRADGDRKREAFEELVRLLMVHESAEEEVVHPIARRQVGEAVVDARLLEEADLKTLIADLHDHGLDDGRFGRQFNVLETAFRDHAEREEQAEFPALRRTLDPASLWRMARAVRTAEAVAPTHPQADVHALGNVVAEPPTALFDRVRNRFERWRQSRRK